VSRALLLCTLVALGACRGISPLTNKIEVGSDPFLVMVGEGADRQTDLYAVSAGGGEVTRLTFTRDSESAPTLDPSGVAIAFLRSRPGGGSSRTWLVVMNLINSAEREHEVPGSLGKPRHLGWSRDGRTIYLSGDSGFAATPAPPAALAVQRLDSTDARIPAADSAVSVLLGDPPSARVENCATDCISTAAAKQCVVAATGERQDLGAGVRSPLRWGSDSLAYFEGDDLVVRPLGGGRPRRVAWVRPPAQAREATYWSRD
jgi:hypothetical protein